MLIAASVAPEIACLVMLFGSSTPREIVSFASPSVRSYPMKSPDSLWAAVSFRSESIPSYPAFAANALGIDSSASAHASIASCSRPGTVSAYLRRRRPSAT